MNRNMRAFMRVGTVGAAAAVFGLADKLRHRAQAPPPAPAADEVHLPAGQRRRGVSRTSRHVQLLVRRHRAARTSAASRQVAAPAFGGSRPGGDRGGAPAAQQAAAAGAGARAAARSGAVRLRRAHRRQVPPQAAGAAGARRGGGPVPAAVVPAAADVAPCATHTSTNYKAFLTDEEYAAATGRAADVETVTRRPSPRATTVARCSPASPTRRRSRGRRR